MRARAIPVRRPRREAAVGEGRRGPGQLYHLAEVRAVGSRAPIDPDHGLVGRLIRPPQAD